MTFEAHVRIRAYGLTLSPKPRFDGEHVERRPCRRVRWMGPLGWTLLVRATHFKRAIVP